MRLGVGGALRRKGFVRAVCAVALAGGVGLPVSLEARPVASTKVTYYSITGSSAQELDQQMNSLGPRVNGDHAYANIVVKPDYDGQLVDGKVCKLNNFRVKADFVMTLPKLAPGTRLSKDLDSRWRSFSSFARRHEETHRSIWMECLTTAERRVLAIRAPTCSGLDSGIRKVFDEEWQRCEVRQSAFDASERIRLGKHPLIVAASRVQRNTAALRQDPRNQTRNRADQDFKN